MTSVLETTVEIVIFVSYCILSCIVFEVFLRNLKNLNEFKIIALVILTSIFLILCAFTHLHKVWGGKGHDALLYMSAIVSGSTAVVAINLRPSMSRLLANRFMAAKLIKDETILHLMKWYNLNVDIEDGVVTRGIINGGTVSHPRRMSFDGTLGNGSVVGIHGKKFRVIHKIFKSLSLDDKDVEEAQKNYTLYGVDITDEYNNDEIIKTSNQERLTLCISTAHDIKTPLTSVSYLANQVRVDSQETTLIVEELLSHLEILNLVATQMMDVGRLLGGHTLLPNYAILNVREVFRRVEKITEYIHDADIECQFQVDINVPEACITDPEWFWHIFLNFMTNALKYTSSGYIRSACSANKSPTGRISITLCVEDTGIGISEDDRPHVFDMFVGIGGHSHGSKGVGLYTVKNKLNSLGGTCSVKPNEGGGSIFEAGFPVLDALPGKKDRVVSLDKDRTKEFLVVDDTESILRVMKHSLMRHNVDTARNGEEGLEMMLEKEYSVVFMDLSMPVLDGIGAVTKFRELEESLGRRKKQVILMMSATEIDRPDLFDDKFPKPLNMAKLKSVVGPVS